MEPNIQNITYNRQMSLSTVAYTEVDSIVSSWTKKYQYHISVVESKPSLAIFMVEFSLTKPEKPIPVGTVRVYFTCKCDDQLSITFRFEKDSLIHSVDKTIRNKEIEKWIDDVLAKKLLVRKAVFYLGTTYEQTRVRDERLDKLLEIPFVPEPKQEVHIDADLLADQQRSIEIMEKPAKTQQSLQADLRLYFREIDTENIGVVTRPEFLKIVDNLGLKLNDKQKEQLLIRADKQNTGTVEYSKYEEIAREVLEAKHARGNAETMLEAKREQEIFTTILTLVNDEVQDINDMVVQGFIAGDEDETGLTNISEVKTVLEGINKKFKEEGKVEPLSPIEMAEITKILTDKYGYKTIPYREIHRHIIEYKIKVYSTGLINSKMSKLEVYIRQICDKYDEKKFGRIKINDLVDAIQKSGKIKLIQAQVYLLKSILPVDSKGDLSYIENSKFLAEIIKKFYIHSSSSRPHPQ